MRAVKSRSSSRRKTLIFRYLILSLGLVSAVTAAVVLLMRQPSEKYSPGSAVEGITNELARQLPEDYPRVQFVDVAQQAGIDFRHFPAERTTQLPEDMGSGAAWGDYDNDGYLDLYICDLAGSLGQFEAAAPAWAGGNRLYRNLGNGSFQDVTQLAGVGFQGLSMAAAWADYDNDGDLDLAVTAYRRLMLYRNRGDGTFEDVSAQAGISGQPGFWAGASWADYDRDGHLDLYICGYVQYQFRPEDAGHTARQYTQVIPFTLNPSSYQPERNLLFRNNGKGAFAEVAKKAGVDNPTGRSLSASWADFDQDGWPDLYVANDVSDNVMYRNQRDGTFADISHAAWVADYRGAMGLAVGDWDRDLDADLFVTHWIAQENGFYLNLLRTAESAAPAQELKFTDVADMSGLGQISLNLIGWGTSFFDYDNDGRLDLFVSNGSTFQQPENTKRLVPMQNHLYWQKSAEAGFFEVGRVSGDVFSQPRVGRGAAFADYDNDGDIDIVVVNQQDRPLLLKNEGGNANNWLKVRVRGASANRSALGARVEIETAAGKQFQEIGSQSSYLSQNALDAHFGLGKLAEVKSLTVVFPSGVERKSTAVAANQTVVVEE